MRTFVVEHPALLFRDPEKTEIHKLDWLRIRKVLSGQHPKRLPQIIPWERWTDPEALYRDAPYLAVDCEWVPHAGQLLCVGMGAPQCPIVQWWPQHEGASPSWLVKGVLRALFRTHTVVFHNAMADIPVIERHLGLGYEGYQQVEDTMFLHACLWTELPHDLEFLDSLYGVHEKLKHLPTSDPRYNAGDVATTILVYEALRKEVAHDPGVEGVYRNSMLPLIPILLEAQHQGIRVERERVAPVAAMLSDHHAVASRLAAAYAGFPLNLGSQGATGQVARFLTHDLGKTVKSVDDDTVAELRTSFLPFDPDEDVTPMSVMARVDEGAHMILECRALYARAQQYLSHYVEPMLERSDGRVYPQFHPWTQHTGRWSTVGFPAAQLPHELRDALIPDEGWVWYEFDWTAIELRLVAYLSGDQGLLEALDKGWDIHTLNMCEIFGLPKPRDPTKGGIAADTSWQEAVKYGGSDDDRRRFSKALVFRVCYGGKPEGAPMIPGARRLGLEDRQLVAVSKRWIGQHPAIKRFWEKIIREGLRQRIGRTIFGRRWCFLGHDKARITRQLYDLPMQGAVADIMNLTLIAIKKALQDRVRLSYTMHDSIKLQVKVTPTVEEDTAIIQRIAQREWHVGGLTMWFPAEFRERL